MRSVFCLFQPSAAMDGGGRDIISFLIIISQKNILNFPPKFYTDETIIIVMKRNSMKIYHPFLRFQPAILNG
jgi:hypothetical protein